MPALSAEDPAVILTWLLFSYVARAQIDQTVDQLNRAVGAPEMGCETCAGQMSSQMRGVRVTSERSSLIKSCLDELCPNSAVTDDSVRDSINQKMNDPLFDREIAPLVKAVDDAERQNAALKNGAFQKWSENPPPINDLGTIRLFNLLRAIDAGSKFEYVNGGSGSEIDSAKSRPRFPELSDAEYAKLESNVRRVNSGLEKTAFEETDPSRVRALYPGAKFASTRDAALAAIDKRQKEWSTESGLRSLTKLPALREVFNTQRLRMQLKDGPSDASAVAELNAAVGMSTLFSDLLHDPVARSEFLSGPIDTKALARQKTALKPTAPIPPTQSSHTKSNDMKQCRAAFATGQGALPSNTEIRKFAVTEVPRLKTTFISKVRERLSSHSAEILVPAIQKWRPVFSQSREEHLKELKNSLGRARDYKKTIGRQETALAGSPDRDTIYALSMALRSGPAAEATASEDVCRQAIPQYGADIADGTRFVVGALPVRFGKNADGIAFHEMAHLLAYEIKEHQLSSETTEGVIRSRECLIANHTELSADERARELKKYRREATSRFDSEDWADNFASGLTGPNQNFACALVSKKSDADSLKMKSSGHHSSTLFRLLNVNYQQTNKTPAKCEEAVRAGGESATFQNCIDKFKVAR